MDFSKKGFSTRAIHDHFHHDQHNGAVMPPIYLATTFAQKAPGQFISHFEYSRTNNPTREMLEHSLASLESAQYALCFSSGCAAFATLLETLEPNSHVVVSDDIYGGSMRLLEQVFKNKGVGFTLCDLTQPDTIRAALRASTQLVWLETPSNPLLKIIDIKKISNIVKQYNANIVVAVDNTFATPYLQNPILLGADLVSHSSTKYLGGHSDVLGGVLITNESSLHEKLAFLQNAIGSVPSPFDCYLLLRSIKTLSIRMQAHCQNAKLIANYLHSHPKVKSVFYPGLEHHPQHHIAKQQMRDFGGMISVVLNMPLDNIIMFMQKLKLFTLAESLGGVESLIEHPATMTHAAIPKAHRQKIGIEDGLVRLSVGIEDPNDLIEDLRNSLS